MLRIAVNPLDPDEIALSKAAAMVRAGGIVAFPTDTFYGLAADPFNAQAVERVLLAKSRPAERALPLIASDIAQIALHLGELPPLAARLAARFWPGPLTVLIPAPETLRATVAAGTGKVGVRVPDHAVARGLCRSCGVPLTATSANISGQPALDDPGAVASALQDVIDLLLDGGRTAGGVPSTLVDTTEALPRVLRQGAVSWEQIQSCIEHA